MQITEVKVFPVQEEKLKAFVSVVFDGCFMVNDIKIIRGREGLFISMPSRKKKNGEFKDVAHPLNNDTRRTIETQILSEYERVLEERGESSSNEAGPEPQPRRETPRARRGSLPESPPILPAKDRSNREPSDSAIDLPGAVPALSPRPLPSPANQPQTLAARAEAPPAAESQDATLEEVEELHLRDSFWTVT